MAKQLFNDPFAKDVAYYKPLKIQWSWTSQQYHKYPLVPNMDKVFYVGIRTDSQCSVVEAFAYEPGDNHTEYRLLFEVVTPARFI